MWDIQRGIKSISPRRVSPPNRAGSLLYEQPLNLFILDGIHFDLPDDIDLKRLYMNGGNLVLVHLLSYKRK